MANKKNNKTDKQKLLEAFDKRLPRMTTDNLRLMYTFAVRLEELEEAVDICSKGKEVQA